MEMSDGIDFEAWNATVRSLAQAVDKLERTAKELANPPWAKAMLDALEEVSIILQNPEEVGLWYPPKIPLIPPESGGAAPVDPPDPETPELLSGFVEPQEETVSSPEPGNAPKTPTPSHTAIRFGDPEAIARYGRRRRR